MWSCFINFYVFVKEYQRLEGFHCVLFDVTMQEVESTTLNEFFWPNLHCCEQSS